MFQPVGEANMYVFLEHIMTAVIVMKIIRNFKRYINLVSSNAHL